MDGSCVPVRIASRLAMVSFHHGAEWLWHSTAPAVKSLHGSCAGVGSGCQVRITGGLLESAQLDDGLGQGGDGDGTQQVSLSGGGVSLGEGDLGQAMECGNVVRNLIKGCLVQILRPIGPAFEEPQVGELDACELAVLDGRSTSDDGALHGLDGEVDIAVQKELLVHLLGPIEGSRVGASRACWMRASAPRASSAALG